MIDKIKEHITQVEAFSATTLIQVEDFRIKYLGSKGLLKEFFAAFIKNGNVANLLEEFEKDDSAWGKSLFKKALDVNRFPEGNIHDVVPGIYGVPIDVTNIQMLYNKNLFKTNSNF